MTSILNSTKQVGTVLYEYGLLLRLPQYHVHRRFVRRDPNKAASCSLTLQSRSVARSREHISDKPEIHRGGGGGGGGGGAAQPRTHADARSLVVRRFSSFNARLQIAHIHLPKSLQVRRATGQESASAKLVQALAPSVHFTEHGHAQFRWRASSAALARKTRRRSRGKISLAHSRRKEAPTLQCAQWVGG